MTGRSLAALAVVVLASCSGSSDDAPRITSDRTADTATTIPSGSDDTDAVTLPSTATSSAGPSSDGARPGVVALAGSVESVLAEIPEAGNFASGVDGWLAAVPGQEGVLRNSRGITLFVPIDEGFSVEDREAMLADPDVAAVTISDHLHVGALATLDGSVTTASGVEQEVSRESGDQTIGGRLVVGSVVATNGVVYLIDGPLSAAAG